MKRYELIDTCIADLKALVAEDKDIEEYYYEQLNKRS